MTRFQNRLLWHLASSLDSEERLAVIGDLEELGRPFGSAVLDVLELSIWRQVALWRRWQPWFVLFTLIIPAAALLSLGCEWLIRSYTLNLWLLHNYRDLDPRQLAEAGLSIRPQLFALARNSLLIFSWSWACGWVLGSQARRMAWVNGSLFLLFVLLFGTCLNKPHQNEYASFLPLLLRGVLLFFPLILGLRKGSTDLHSSLLRILLWSSAIATAFVARNWFWWPLKSSLPMQLLLLTSYWPIAYLMFTAVRLRYARRASLD